MQLNTDFEALIDELEADPANKAAFENADNWIASTFYGGDIESMRTIRQRRGITQAALASKIGTSQSQIAKIESGGVDPQLSTILKLADTLSEDANTICAALGASVVKKLWSSR